ncbi:uncharacterized protein DNG_04681 [Cephalotrichum gorgonifer]|uniref:Uncharacterized protein n=1 Tax=Cephalotrichum gorgonifer TaxID=2041049 RepID=A0AAE8SUS5_9PEZI|nr:uncharacterized protein DNG_04681 [Cephalotrichum gorgonifer]
MIRSLAILALAAAASASADDGPFPLTPAHALTHPRYIAARADSGAVNGSLLTYPIPGCSDESPLGGGNHWTMAPDHCLKVSTSTTVRILEPAVCANGTRAKLARYEGRDCNHGEVTLPGGLVDVEDSDLNTCQNVWLDKYPSNKTVASVASFGFYCDGRKGDWEDGEEEGSKEKWGSVSLNVCPRGSDPPRAPTFDHPMPGECNAILTSERLSIFFAATCSDGSEAKLATWDGTRMCEGKYSKIQDVTEDLMKQCFFVNQNNHSSFAFWCPDSEFSGGADIAVLSRAVVSLVTGVWLVAGLYAAL